MTQADIDILDVERKRLYAIYVQAKEAADCAAVASVAASHALFVARQEMAIEQRIAEAVTVATTSRE